MANAIQNNSYRILGLETSVSQKDILRRYKEIINRLKESIRRSIIDLEKYTIELSELQNN